MLINLRKNYNVETRHNYLKELIVEYRPRLKSFIQKKVTKKSDAEDILQDVFYQLVKTVNVTMNPIENVSAWLYKVARNTIINSSKKKREEPLPVFRDDETDDGIIKDFSEILFRDDVSTSSPEMEYLRSLVWIELEKALAELPPEQREVFVLTEFDSIPIKDIAELTKVSVNTLLSRKHYAVLHLRKRLSGLYYDLIYS